MPRLNGFQAAKELRKMQIATPIILFTDYALEVRHREVTESGVNAVVLKPDLTELHKQVQFLLSHPTA
jgi:CheY-like chemotaxis protein